MKTGFFLFLTLLLRLPAPAQPHPKDDKIPARQLSITPPGVVWVNDSLAVDETEVANIHWLEYLHYVQRDSSRAFYQAQLPDTTVWAARLREIDDTTDVYLSYYLRYPGFRYFPVVGISYQQAVDYCEWRSRIVNTSYRTRKNTSRWERKLLAEYDVTVTYRLPTIAEWETAAAGKLNPLAFPYGIRQPSPPGSYQARHPKFYQTRLRPQQAIGLPLRVRGQLIDSTLYYPDFSTRGAAYVMTTTGPYFLRTSKAPSFNLEYIYAHPPNGYGLYNMIGNVAELTATEGVAKGGSFEESANDFTLQTNFPYDKPGEWLGFRCVCTVAYRRKSPPKP